MKQVKKHLQALFNVFGYKVQKQTPVFIEQVTKLCLRTNCNLLFDVGANEGQYARLILNSGFKGDIVSIEPQNIAFHVLLRESSRFTNWKVANRCVLGESDSDNVLLYISDNSVSSSLLKKTDVLSAFSQVGTEYVPMLRFDTLYNNDFSSKLFFLKIDTQGYEFNVLKGCGNTLDFCVGIQFEASLIEVYHESPTFVTILTWLEDLGFEIYDCLPEARDNGGRLVEMDILMINKKYV
jgi:FkbM family methyltransferase